MSELLEGYKFYKKIQGTRYNKDDIQTKQKLQKFRDALGKFTDYIFLNFIPLEKGMWQNSGNFSKYMWNRYKPQQDESNLVVYFNASTNEKEGLFLSIGLIDDRLTEYEISKSKEIYNFLEDGCKKIISKGFERKDSGWGERVFSIHDENKFEFLDYSDLIQQLSKLYKETYKKFYENETYSGFESSQKNKMLNNKRTQPLNQILYGPPGTGKTYHTINKALEIIDGIVPKNRKDAKEKFEEYRKSGQIEFVTFHQSYGYEEFVEGIKAIPPKEKGNENGTEMIYKVVGGIFKKLCEKANDKSFSFKEKIEKYRELLQNEEINLKTATGVPFKLSKSDYGINTQTNHSFSVNKLIEINDGKLSSNPDGTYGRFIVEDIHKRFPDNELKNYILIIDEINRGNISKIFGELITLIEPSKRIGAEESLHVRLPYSNESFGVPSNFYIIGTMNTADRSIALMDTALRRRFDFTEMMPRPEVLNFEIEGVHVKSMLETINKRIEYLYDRDHTIGHAYFIEAKSKDDLDNVMKNKIIPLLQEYFYDDWEKIVMVLGNGFIEKSEIKSDIFTYKNDDHIEEEQATYTIKSTFDFSEFKK